jgi:hypothetical protein
MPSLDMKRLRMFFVAFLLTGCTTNDFEVLKAIQPGMTSMSARKAIRAYGFEIEECIKRPVNGWPSEREDFVAAGWRAGRIEAIRGSVVTSVESYPVGHGLLSAGQLFLFYGEDNRLLEFYRYQIN